MRQTQSAKKINTGSKIVSAVTAVFCVVMLAVFLSACGAAKQDEADTVLVSIVDSQAFTPRSSRIMQVSRGTDITVTLEYYDRYEFSSCNYDEYSVNVREGHEVQITLHNVLYPFRLSIESVYHEGRQVEILYHLSGGSVDGAEEYTQTTYLTDHLRANTSIAAGVEREGYTLYGWNTEPDGSGEHIGLGSRFTVPEGGKAELYAQWLPWESDDKFEYSSLDGEIVITGYNGGHSSEVFVLPGMIEGKPVTEIATGFLKDFRGGMLVLPDTLKVIHADAFKDCAFQEIIFFDNIQDICDASFSGGSFTTWHINAARPPAYQGISEFTQFADNIDRLMLSKDRKKLVLFAGCSMGYGLNSYLMKDEFEDFEIFNMGIVGGNDAVMQFDCIIPFLEAGDVFVHAPEVASPNQLMNERLVDIRSFTMIEGNYDLLTYTDMGDVSGAFDQFSRYNRARNMLQPTSYEAYKKTYNQYGDYTGPHPDRGVDIDQRYERYTYVLSYLNETAMSALCDKYDEMAKKQVKVFFSFAPVNYHGLSKEDIDIKIWETFQEKCEEELSKRGYAVISNAEDYLFEGRYFYDTDYHLGEAGAKLRTQRLIKDLKQAM